ncbi:protein-export chaperone SecB [Fangia hongkongensis]|uniref:protein-export chaperone SecB n=1 Tax=Fangia hongkongensis TaxID=270495 RepID=UPI000368978A|nr:protein-export chaperone SecB [Fangia hongkongensis]MBK2125681.1 protein-export chaperone SecB [Fangia hongkongensis]
MTDTNEAKTAAENEVQFQIQKVYIKDISFEIPKGAHIFNREWKPELNIALNTQVNALPEDNIFEVVLTVEANVKCADDDAFKAEVQQAGIFVIDNMNEEQLEHAKYAFCPNILYPYAREAISDIVSKGGFPQLCLAPVNFDMLYQQKQQEQQASA